jgi:hypothetical protein
MTISLYVCKNRPKSELFTLEFSNFSRISNKSHSIHHFVVVFSVYLEFRKHIMALVRVLSILEGSEEIKPSFQYC